MKSITLIFFLLMLTSCTKFGKNVTIKGGVLNPITGEGIADAEIWLQKTTIGLPGGLKTVKKVTSSSDGSFELDKFGLAGYTAICIAGDRYDLGWTQDGGISFTGNLTLSVKKGKVMHADYYAVPYGEIKISIHNVNCQGVNDTLIYMRKYISFEGVSVFQPFILTGCYNTDGNYAKVPSGDYSVEWIVIRNGISNFYSTSLTVPENGQVEYNIDY